MNKKREQSQGSGEKLENDIVECLRTGLSNFFFVSEPEPEFYNKMKR